MQGWTAARALARRPFPLRLGAPGASLARPSAMRDSGFACRGADGSRMLPLAACGALLACAAAALAQQPPPPLGEEFQVNEETAGFQGEPAVAMDAGGGFVAVWRDSGGDAGDVLGRLFDAAGNPLGGEFLVNTFTTGNQRRPAVARDGAGNFVVVWDSFGQDGSSYGVFAQRYDADGLPLGGEFQVNSHTTDSQASPAVAADAAGGFVVVWHGEGQDGSGYGIFGQRYDADGDPVGVEFPVNTATAQDQRDPAVAAAPAGDFLVAWSHRLDESPPQDYGNIFAQRYDEAGVPVGGEFQVNETGDGQYDPAVAADAAGNFVVVWSNYYEFSTGDDVMARRFPAEGDPGPEFVVNESPYYFQREPAVAVRPAGDFVVAWLDPYQDGYYRGVFGRAFDATGSPLGGDFLIPTYTTGDQSSAAVAASASGRFVVVWRSDFQDGDSGGIFGQRFLLGFFADGFESGDTSAWDATVQ